MTMKHIRAQIEIDGDQAWTYTIRSCDYIPDAPLHDMLRWVLEQLHTGSCRLEKDDTGDVVSVVFGKGAAQTFPAPVWENAEQSFQQRYAAINIAGLFALAREGGIRPEDAGIAEKARVTATENAFMNTDFHYAFQLVKTLKRIHEKTFVFTTPPIAGRVGADVSRLLREATRAYLFGLNRACISMCRALIEGSLKERVPRQAVRDEQYQFDKGPLQALIDVSAQRGVLDDTMRKVAHSIRQAGNEALHEKEPTDERSWEVLLGTRALIEHACARTDRG
jgi:hypothetical protein